MAKASLPGLELDFDTKSLKKRFGAQRIRAVENIAMKRLLVELLSRIRQGFAVGGWNPETGKPRFWPKRKTPDAGTSAKSAKGVVKRIRRGGRTLVDTGRYLESITKSDVSNGRGGPEGSVGTNVPYAKYHEQPGSGGSISYKATGKQAAFLRALGFTGVRKNTTITLPQRRVFVMPEPWADDFAEIYRDEMITELSKESV